jgi:repressor LexA
MESDTRDKVYAFVRRKILAGVPPTVRDVQHHFKFNSSGSAREHIDKLVDEGRLLRIPGVSRGLRLPPQAGKKKINVQIPLVGTVAAGHPALAFDDPLDYISYDTYAPTEELFALKVRGESMTGAGILPGDIVIVRKQTTAESGQIVVAMLGDEEATVKTLQYKFGRYELHPANKDYPVMVEAPKRKLSILGKVVEIRRAIPD